MVNLNKVHKIDKLGKGKVILEGGQTIPLDTCNKESFIEQLMEYNSKKAKN
jgi:DNA-binding LytR/AlgR family response regulator